MKPYLVAVLTESSLHVDGWNSYQDAPSLLEMFLAACLCPPRWVLTSLLIFFPVYSFTPAFIRVLTSSIKADLEPSVCVLKSTLIS